MFAECSGWSTTGADVGPGSAPGRHATCRALPAAWMNFQTFIEKGDFWAPVHGNAITGGRFLSAGDQTTMKSLATIAGWVSSVAN